jgi:hypothetical protein
MPYEILWAFLVLVTVLSIGGGLFCFRHLRKKQVFEQKYRLRQLLHDERMAAIEKDVPLIEIPSLEEEIFALTEEAIPEQVRRRKLWQTSGVLLTSVSAGISASFYLSGEENLQEIWMLGLIGLAAGIGCLVIAFNNRA